MTDNLTIGAGTQVTLHFSLSLENGDTIDSNFESDAPTFVFGDGNLMAGFEEVLAGLSAGDKKEFIIPPEKGFGQPNPGNFQDVNRASFDESMVLDEGLVVTFADPSGGEIHGVVKSFDDDKVEVDFNHPLSGRNIIFKVQILDVQPVVKH